MEMLILKTQNTNRKALEHMAEAVPCTVRDFDREFEVQDLIAKNYTCIVVDCTFGFEFPKKMAKVREAFPHIPIICSINNSFEHPMGMKNYLKNLGVDFIRIGDFNEALGRVLVKRDFIGKMQTLRSKRKNQNTVEIVSQPKEPYQPAKQPDLWRSFENPMKLIMGKILQNSPAS